MLAYHIQFKLQIALAKNYKWYLTLLPIALDKKNRKKKIQGYIIKQPI